MVIFEDKYFPGDVAMGSDLICMDPHHAYKNKYFLEDMAFALASTANGPYYNIFVMC